MEGREIWRQVLAHLEAGMTPANFDTWLRPTRVLRFDDRQLTVGCPNTYAKEWLEQRLLASIRKALQDLGLAPLELHFRVVSEVPPTGTTAKGRRSGRDSRREFPSATTFNQRYTFESFIVGSNNRFARAAAEAVVDRPGQIYNPLFIYGGVGLGKTHLLHAIGNRMASYRPDVAAVYTTCERFMNEMIKAVRDGSIERFRDKYRPVDILLIDDIQFIAGKESTQEELFHTFNAVHDSGKQIVISSDRPPKLIATLAERLRSRFAWGLIADIQPPDLETRIAILRYKAELQHMPIPPDVIQYIARRTPSNIRELEGSFNRAVAYASLNDKQLNIELAQAALDSMEGGPHVQLTPAKIIECVAQYYHLPVADLVGKGRGKAVVVPRQIAMYLVREETSASLEQIGSLLGGRDHTTVMYGYDKISEAVQDDHQLRNDVVAIRSVLYESAAS